MVDQNSGRRDEHIANIGERGARRRRAGGVVSALIGGVLLVYLLLSDAPRWDRAVLVVPFALAAIGFFQAREKTCVALGVVGKREADVGDPTLSAREQPIVRRQVVRVVAKSLAVAIVATAIALAL